MAFNLFNRFILTLKRVFHKIARYVQARKTLVTMQPERLEKEGQVSKIMPETPLEQVPPKAAPQTIREETLAKIPSQVPQEETRGEESEPELTEELTDIEPKKHTEDEKVTPMPRKPYRKKPPTEERKEESRKLSATEKKLPKLKRWEIDLGDLLQKPRRIKGRPEVPLAEIDHQAIDEGLEEKEVVTPVESPFVEIDVSKGKVFLVLPQQRFKFDKAGEIPQRLSYRLQLNGEQQYVSVNVTHYNGSFAVIEEKRICLETPLESFLVHFPEELQSRVYRYSQADNNIYVFTAIGNNLGRMCYLYDSGGNVNPVPKKVIWILVSEDCELQTEPGAGDIVGEEWIWKHRPFRIDLREKGNIAIRNKVTKSKVTLAGEATFYIEGEKLIEDEFRRECPLFTDKTLRLVAPSENPSAWLVWIQNKLVGYRLVSRNWTGTEPLAFRLPDDLPCECGEFQIDICQQAERTPIDTLFFRWLPFIKLDYPKKLIIPDSHHGHVPQIIEVDLGGIQVWELRTKQSLIEGGVCQIELPPEEDALQLRIREKSKPETEVRLQVTIPRLRWRISKQEVWSDKLQETSRASLTLGQDLHLFISTNDLFTEYDFLAILRTKEQELQTTKFRRRGMHHTLLLNEFYDTIRQNKNALTLIVGIRGVKDYESLGTAEVLYFDAEEVIRISHPPERVSYDLVHTLRLPKICLVLRRIKAARPKEKPICKEILQVYYQGIIGEKRGKRETSTYKRIFVVKSLAFIKFIVDTYGDKVPIRRQKKWKARIDLLQQQYPEEFSSAFDTYSRR